MEHTSAKQECLQGFIVSRESRGCISHEDRQLEQNR